MDHPNEYQCSRCGEWVEEAKRRNHNLQHQTEAMITLPPNVYYNGVNVLKVMKEEVIFFAVSLLPFILSSFDPFIL
jgi:hypothetical protein